MGMTPDPDSIATQRDCAVAETMETMAFLEIRHCPDKDGPAADALACTVPFVTPYQGRLTLAMPADIVREISVTLVGSEERSMMVDTLKEIANTIAGRLLGMVAPTGGPIAVGVPKDDDQTDDAMNWAHYRLDDGRRFSVGIDMAFGDTPCCDPNRHLA